MCITTCTTVNSPNSILCLNKRDTSTTLEDILEAFICSGHTNQKPKKKRKGQWHTNCIDNLFNSQ